MEELSEDEKKIIQEIEGTINREIKRNIKQTGITKRNQDIRIRYEVGDFTFYADIDRPINLEKEIISVKRRCR